MAATSDWRLYQLYMEFGAAQDRRNRVNEAADAYALALYYARRLNDPARVNECRQLVLTRSPNHVAGQAVSAPLFFAQLLMRYPADEVEHMLAGGRPAVAVAEEAPPIDPPPEERTFRRTQTIKPTYEGVAQSSAHHHSEPTFAGGMRPEPRPFVTDDVLLSDADPLDEEPDAPRRKTTVADLSAAVKALAAGSITSGLLLVAYIGYSIYPMVNPVQVRKEAPLDLNDDHKIVVAEDAVASKKVETVAPPPKPAPTAPAKKKQVAASGANTPVSLSNESALKVADRPGEDPSR
jgi:hypothetical protein